MSETVDILTRATRLYDQIAEIKGQVHAARIAREKADAALLAAKSHERTVCAALRELEASPEFKFINQLDLKKVAKEPKRIIKRIADEHGVTYEDIVGRSRKVEIKTARWAAIAAVREAHPNFTLNQIGRYFKRDHTTILHALRESGVEMTTPTRSDYVKWFEDLDRAILQRVLDGVPRPQIMAELNISRMKVTRALQRHAPELVVTRGPTVRPRDKEILEAFDACGKPCRVALQIGVDRKTVKRAIERRERLRAAANSNEFLKAAA